MSRLVDLDLGAARAGLRRREFSAREFAAAYNEAVAAARPLNAYITPTPELALAMADAADERLRRGDERPLDGIPIAVKDVYCTKGVRTTAASHILDGFYPPYEATVTQRLWQAGAVMLGKTNLDEFAMGSSSTTGWYGPVKNPWRRSGDNRPLVAGGSSGGSAAAVAAHAALAGYDPRDSTSAALPVPDFEAALTGDIRGLRIGLPREYRAPGMPAAIEALWQRGAGWLAAAGAEPIEVSLPHTRYALPAYYIIAPAEASSNLARYDGVRFGLRVEGNSLDEMYELTRAAGFGAEVRRRVLIGTYALSAGYYDAYYLKAQRVRTLIARDFTQAFARVDCLLAPTAPSAAFPIGEHADNPVAMYLNDVFTVPANLAGLPALSLPAGLAEGGLPLGLQVIGRAFDEATVLRVAAVLESAAQFRHRPGGGTA